MAVPVKKKEKNTIQVHGLFGQFYTPNSQFSIHYFSTYANAYESHHSELLNQLKPMRERINSNQIEGIDALLQRDLDDIRVSESLIPYLKNLVYGTANPSHIAFFPAILAVLIPKGFIRKPDQPDTGIRYPNAYDKTITEQDIAIDERYYSSAEPENGNDYFWKEQRYSESRLGELQIDTGLTEIIVLDGQHRANAFRVLTDSFFEYQRNNLYECFYDQDNILRDYKSDLPVTIIWFEENSNNASKIKPTAISRDLFIAVNDNARQISEGRKILLNDRDPSSILTKFFYSKVAGEVSFDNTKGKVSLLHLGFDINTDLRDQKSHRFTLTTPEQVHGIFEWLMFGTRRYVSLDNLTYAYKIGAATRKFNLEQFNELLPECEGFVRIVTNEYGEEIKSISADADPEQLRQAFQENIYPVLRGLLNEFLPYRCHLQATQWIAEERHNWTGNTYRHHAWDSVFNGGEGLYYSLHSLTGKDNSKGKELREACDEILTLFTEKRAALWFGDNQPVGKTEIALLDKVYNSITSQSFQISLVFAFHTFREQLSPEENLETALRQFTLRLNAITPKAWIAFFTEVSKAIFGSAGTDPKWWPASHKLILRMIGRPGELFDTDNGTRIASPDAYILREKFLRICKAHAKNKGTELAQLKMKDFPETWLEEKTVEAIGEARTILASADLTLLDFDHKGFMHDSLKSVLK